MSSDEFRKYETACVKIKEQNAQLLADFQKLLSEKGLAAKTIKEYVQNVDFYVNTYLLYEDAIPAEEVQEAATKVIGDCRSLRIQRGQRHCREGGQADVFLLQEVPQMRG